MMGDSGPVSRLPQIMVNGIKVFAELRRRDCTLILDSHIIWTSKNKLELLSRAKPRKEFMIISLIFIKMV
jgi:hypothetical protein